MQLIISEVLIYMFILGGVGVTIILLNYFYCSMRNTTIAFDRFDSVFKEKKNQGWAHKILGQVCC